MTDVDYKVYTDAALYDSPYERHTYRYSPVLAYVMGFNHSVNVTCGKIIFVLFDALAVYFLYQVLQQNNHNR